MAVVEIHADRCDRCDAHRPKKDDGGWRANVSAGYITSVTCPDCLSVEENLAMLVNEAMLQVGCDRGGRIMVRPRAQRADEGQS